MTHLRAGGLIDLEGAEQGTGVEGCNGWPWEFPVCAARLPSAVHRKHRGGGGLCRRIAGQLAGRGVVSIQKFALAG